MTLSPIEKNARFIIATYCLSQAQSLTYGLHISRRKGLNNDSRNTTSKYIAYNLDSREGHIWCYMVVKHGLLR